MPTTDASLELRLERVIRAPREMIFAAWTQPELMMQWLGPDAARIADAQADPRPGGSYRVTLRSNCAGEPGGVLTGSYLDVVPNERLRFTWTLPGAATAETTVTVELSDAEGGTRLRLIHQGLPNEDLRARHEHGWGQCLNNLEALAARDTVSFHRRVEIAAARPRVAVLLASVEGNGSWWMARTSGSAAPGGMLRMEYGKQHHLLFRVDHADETLTQWACLECTSHPDWVGTRVVFHLADRGGSSTVLHFRHEGLTPRLECFGQCSAGWDRYLPSLAACAETGAGWPNA